MTKTVTRLAELIHETSSSLPDDAEKALRAALRREAKGSSARLVLRPLGVRPGDGLVPAVTEDQILLQVEAGEQQGTVEADEKEMIENVFELNDLTAADVMVHRKDVVALPAEASWEEIRDTIRRAGVSRIPIYRGSIDTIEGVLNARDFLLRSVDSKSFAIAALLRKPMFVPETVKADVLLKRMQKRKQSIAIIVDDYGGTSGIVTIEDLVEQIVGDLYDEYDGPDDVVEIRRERGPRHRAGGGRVLDPGRLDRGAARLRPGAGRGRGRPRARPLDENREDGGPPHRHGPRPQGRGRARGRRRRPVAPATARACAPWRRRDRGAQDAAGTGRGGLATRRR